jgi:hypothetical protein
MALDMAAQCRYSLAIESTNGTERYMMSDTAHDQAAAQYKSIVRMVAALECDYERLQELRDLRDDGAEHGPTAFVDQHPSEADELAKLEDAAGDCESYEDARQRIEEDALSVEVRSGWTSAGSEFEAEEFRIVLCCGGPHVEIRGELNEHNEPHRAWIEYRGWGERGTYLDVEADTLLAYCNCFHFGE